MYAFFFLHSFSLAEYTVNISEWQKRCTTFSVFTLVSGVTENHQEAAESWAAQ